MASRGSVRRRLAAAAAAFAGTLRNRDLRLAQLGFLGSWTAEWAFTVALGVYAFRDAGAAGVGLVTLVRMLPAALVAPVVTPYADRLRRERVLVGVSAVRGGTTALAGVVVVEAGPALVVYALAVVSSLAAVLYRPVHSALLPSLCRTPAELAGANVVRGLLDAAATLIGPALAALLLATSGVAAVFAAAAVASLVSGAATLRIHPEVVEPLPAPASDRVVARTVSGLRAVAASRDLRMLAALTCAQTFMRGALGVFTVVVAIDLLRVGAPGAGTLAAAVGAGALAGSAVTSLLVGTQRLARWFGIGVALWGLPLALLAADPGQAAALVLLAVVGVGNALVDVGLFTLIARLTPDAMMARVFGALESVIALGVALGSAVTPLAIHEFGLRGGLGILGSVTPLLVAGTWHRLRRLDRDMHTRDNEVTLLRSVPMLDPLPLPAVEQLARTMEPMTVPAGSTVFAEGDIGDRFFVIRDGIAEVVGGGDLITTLGPGDGFGEIALLRRIPRTATVRARSDLRLESLTGDRFVAVVTGFRPSAQQSTTHVDALLDRYLPRQREGNEPVPEGCDS